MIVIIDYGMGNPNSVLNLCNRLRLPAKLSNNAADIRAAERLILPGVGSFDHGMENLRRRELPPLLRERVLDKRVPFLGICIGMHLMARRSEEGKEEGLAWFAADVTRFASPNGGPQLKVPHVGFNAVTTGNSPLFRHLEPNPRFYFTHSYHLRCENDHEVIATAHHGYEFPAVIARDNIFGTQFHPEKSHTAGLALLRAFAEV